MKELNVGLIKEENAIFGIDQYIIERDVSHADIKGIREEILQGVIGQSINLINVINVYVTNLSDIRNITALIELINIVRRHNVFIDMNVYVFDEETKSYIKQEVY